jgi:hypothetical protein
MDRTKKRAGNSMERKFSGSSAYTGRESAVAGEALSLQFLRVRLEAERVHNNVLKSKRMECNGMKANELID